MSESNRETTTTSTDMSRRNFVLSLAVCAAACACGAAVDDASAAPAPAPPSGGAGAAAGGLDVGPVDEIKDGISDKFLHSNKIAIVRNEGKIYACTAVCTHKRALLGVKDGKSFACSKHGSTFSIQGTVTKGPADASLVRYAIKKNDAGHLIVDLKKEFREKQWDDPASFVAV